MKKITIHIIFGFLLGSIVAGGISFALAINIHSDNVEYITDKNTDIKTVEEAINDLYSRV